MNTDYLLGNGRMARIEDRASILQRSLDSKEKSNKALMVKALADWFNVGPGQVCFQALDPSRGYWRFWDGQRWALYEDARFARDLRWLTAGQYLAPELNMIADTLKTEFAVSPSLFNRRKIVVFENCTLCIKDNRVAVCEPSKPEDYATIKLPLSVPSVVAPTPVWDSVIGTLLPDADDRACLQELISYCLFSICKKQVFFCLVGEGGTGKTTILRILGDMMGDGPDGVITAVPLAVLHKDHATASLIGSLLNIDSEAENMERTAEAVLKNISGNGVVFINPKHKPAFSVEVPTKIVLACNSMPRFSDKSAALWQRLVLLPFDIEVSKVVSRTEEIDSLIARLRPEYGSIVLWALQGLQRVLQSGRSRSEAFTQSSRANELLSDHKRWSDPFEAWWEDCIQIVPDAAVPRDVAYTNHCKYRVAGNHTTVAKTTFGRMMAAKLRQFYGNFDGEKRQGHSRLRLYTGISLKADSADKIVDALVS